MMQQMTDASAVSVSERRMITVILAGVATLNLADVTTDWVSGASTPHLGIELLAAGAAILGLGWLWSRYFGLRRRISEAHRSLQEARADALLWRERHHQVLQGLSQAIDLQLHAWKLTPAEREVAFLLLKGLSFKEAAGVRGASERTVRQQALSVYHKSGLEGRAELAAFFLEDLLLPSLPSPSE
jgi:DNA-binding CsgD family transcriptional regulator